MDSMICGDPTDATEAPAPGAIPAGFNAVAVYRCDIWASQEHPDGTIWSGTLLEKMEGNLDEFTAAINADNDPTWPGPCPAMLVVVPELWAEGGSGDFIRLSYPATACAQPKPEAVAAALAGLDVVEAGFTPVSLADSPVATAAGCATRATVMTIAAVTPRDESAKGSPAGMMPNETATIPWEPPRLPEPTDVEGLRVCVYAAEPADSTLGQLTDGGAFTRVFELDAVRAAAIVDPLRTASAADPACSASATLFVQAHPVVAGVPTAPFTVELDGCRRVFGPDFRALSVAPELMADLTPAAP
ncbi:hypothetical protein ASD65_02610 [Microbacterium sp. Root61]|uniref:hypothetical protein n=1 Tax=Microbacterium sp. Root61 TaxID=1736570 RepID=UPI0007016FF3|nr:hypothetical protein [Microbacterium sp. Root61]KRA23428.1 hypothetical protein ASD65_02610 [Microbacterium sp. Root61]